MRVDVSRTLPAAWGEISKVFTALGHEQRQRILLMFDAGEKLNVSQIAEAFDLSRTAVAHHLKALYDANILVKQRVGKEVFYWLDATRLETALQDVLDYIRENYK